MSLAEIRRYPVKSMAGERLRDVSVGALGLVGDRVVHVESKNGRVVTARTHPRLLGHHAVVDARGEPLVDGRPWTDPSVTADIQAAMKLSVKGLATAFALLWGGCLFLVGILHVALPPYGAAFLQGMSSVYPGFHGSGGIGDVLVGTITAAADGAIGGALLAWLYNAFTMTARL